MAIDDQDPFDDLDLNMIELRLESVIGEYADEYRATSSRRPDRIPTVYLPIRVVIGVDLSRGVRAGSAVREALGVPEPKVEEWWICFSVSGHHAPDAPECHPLMDLVPLPLLYDLAGGQVHVMSAWFERRLQQRQSGGGGGGGSGSDGVGEHHRERYGAVVLPFVAAVPEEKERLIWFSHVVGSGLLGVEEQHKVLVDAFKRSSRVAHGPPSSPSPASASSCHSSSSSCWPPVGWPTFEDYSDQMTGAEDDGGSDGNGEGGVSGGKGMDDRVMLEGGGPTSEGRYSYTTEYKLRHDIEQMEYVAGVREKEEMMMVRRRRIKRKASHTSAVSGTAEPNDGASGVGEEEQEQEEQERGDPFAVWLRAEVIPVFKKVHARILTAASEQAPLLRPVAEDEGKYAERLEKSSFNAQLATTTTTTTTTAESDAASECGGGGGSGDGVASDGGGGNGDGSNGEGVDCGGASGVEQEGEKGEVKQQQQQLTLESRPLDMMGLYHFTSLDFEDGIGKYYNRLLHAPPEALLTTNTASGGAAGAGAGPFSETSPLASLSLSASGREEDGEVDGEPSPSFRGVPRQLSRSFDGQKVSQEYMLKLKQIKEQEEQQQEQSTSSTTSSSSSSVVIPAVVVDNVMSVSALGTVRKLLMESTFWYETKSPMMGGYLGAYGHDGLHAPQVRCVLCLLCFTKTNSILDFSCYLGVCVFFFC
jgi:hypothetical protein